MSTATPAPEPYRAKIWKNQRGEPRILFTFWDEHYRGLQLCRSNGGNKLAAERRFVKLI